MAMIPKAQALPGFLNRVQPKLPDKGNALGWMILPLKRYAQFDGRSGRREFWWYSLLLTLSYSAAIFLAIALAATDIEDGAGILVFLGFFSIVFIANFIPGLALTTRRMHDIGWPGWLSIMAVLVVFLFSIFGWIGYMIVMSLPPAKGENQYGPPVYGDQIADIFG